MLAVYTAYIDAFRANDVPALDKLIQYPLAHIGNGRVTMVETFPVQPAELMAAKGLELDPNSSGLNREEGFRRGLVM